MTPKPALELIESFEKCVLHTYPDGYGFQTIGFGHKILPGEDFGSSITREQADAILQRDLRTAENAVAKLCPVPLTENQRGALISFAFNAGAGTLQRATFRQQLLRLDYEDVPAGMLKYTFSAGQQSRGLLRRRQAEVDLFLA